MTAALYGAALGLVIFLLYRHPWILRLALEATAALAFVLAVLIWAGPLRGIILP